MCLAAVIANHPLCPAFVHRTVISEAGNVEGLSVLLKAIPESQIFILCKFYGSAGGSDHQHSAVLSQYFIVNVDANDGIGPH